MMAKTEGVTSLNRYFSKNTEQTILDLSGAKIVSR